MERRNGNYGADYRAPQEYRHPAVAIEVGSETVPYLREDETSRVTLAPFKDHGRPAFVSSTIKSRGKVAEVAGSLSEEQSQRLNQAMDRTMENLLDEGHITGMTVMSSTVQGKPDVFVINVGNPYSESSLRLYCHQGMHEGVPVLFQDARATRKTSAKIEKELGKAGYSSPVNFDSRKSFGKKK